MLMLSKSHSDKGIEGIITEKYRKMRVRRTNSPVRASKAATIYCRNK